MNAWMDGCRQGGEGNLSQLFFSKFNTLIRTPVLLFHDRTEKMGASYNASLRDGWSVVSWEFTSCLELLYHPNIRQLSLTCVTCILDYHRVHTVGKRKVRGEMIARDVNSVTVLCAKVWNIAPYVKLSVTLSFLLVVTFWDTGAMIVLWWFFGGYSALFYFSHSGGALLIGGFFSSSHFAGGFPLRRKKERSACW